MFTKFVRHDLHYGIIVPKSKLVITFMMFFFLASSHFLSLRIFEIISPSYFEVPPTTGDYFLFLIGGCGQTEFTPGGGSTFIMPTMWMVFVLWMQFTSLYYPFIDLEGIGKHLMAVSGGRGIWWFSKCIWVTVNTTVNYLLVFAAATLSGLCFGAKLSMNANYYLARELDMRMDLLTTDTTWNLWPVMIVTGVFLIAFSMVQLMLSIIVKPLFSYLFLAGFLFAGAYMQAPLLLGNYMMAARSSVLITTGLQLEEGIIICLWIILISLILGYLVFERKDILGKDS